MFNITNSLFSGNYFNDKIKSNLKACPLQYFVTNIEQINTISNNS